MTRLDMYGHSWDYELAPLAKQLVQDGALEPELEAGLWVYRVTALGEKMLADEKLRAALDATFEFAEVH